MNRIILLMLLMASGSIMNAQLCANNTRFSEVPYFTSSDITSQLNMSFASVTDWQGNSQTIRFDVYFPKLTVDTLPKRPLIVLVHGGALQTGNKTDFTEDCRQFALRGFVAATINYRLGKDCATDNLSNDKAAYRAVQDLHAALRYFVANSNTLKIDTNWIFIGGASAGSATCHRLLYTSQAEWNAFSPTLQGLLGNINSSGNPLNNTFTVKGFMNNWGGITKGMVQASEMVPTVAFHGGMDNNVELDSAQDFSCNTAVISYGSRVLHHMLIDSGVCSDLSVQPNGAMAYTSIQSAALFVPAVHLVSSKACFAIPAQITMQIPLWYQIVHLRQQAWPICRLIQIKDLYFPTPLFPKSITA